ncbi:MAG TPA: NTP transferase domain-containing protein, partial [Candidatus Dormibacteraeota bacterium]|nr:NTP transferase domain-containing protein [Candidatus Dormibacteraeota bacterium]
MAEPRGVRAVVLAAGAGTRMRSAHPKVLHEVGGRPLIDWAVELACAVTDASPVVVVGAGHDAVRDRVAGRAVVAVQPVPDGTGGALAAARPLLEDAQVLLVLPGDVPLLRPDTLRHLLQSFAAAAVDAVLLSARPPDPTGYGRIVRTGGGFRAIVEERDLSAAEAGLREVNTGVYVFRPAPLWPALAQLATDNAQGERYL